MPLEIPVEQPVYRRGALLFFCIILQKSMIFFRIDRIHKIVSTGHNGTDNNMRFETVNGAIGGKNERE